MILCVTYELNEGQTKTCPTHDFDEQTGFMYESKNHETIQGHRFTSLFSRNFESPISRLKWVMNKFLLRLCYSDLKLIMQKDESVWGGFCGSLWLVIETKVVADMKRFPDCA